MTGANMGHPGAGETENVIDRARRCAAELYELATRPPASLEAPITKAQADRFLDDLLAWAGKTAEAYGRPRVMSLALNVTAEPAGLLGCFDVRAQDKWVNVGTFESLNPLGQITPEYLWPFQPTPNPKSAFGLSPLDSSVSHVRNWENAAPARYWKEIESALAPRVRDYCLASLRLVAWINQRLKAFEESTLPSITIGPAGKRNKHDVRVSMAGHSRRDSIQDKSALILRTLKEKGEWTFENREEKKRLLDDIPELFHSLNHLHAGKGKLRFGVSPAQRKRIHFKEATL